ncbi:MAG: hypothetical protein Q4G59_11600, partial [Planctomycetia bacterium]|nr:hypothetical protein [Planctomycetia bacterium]
LASFALIDSRPRQASSSLAATSFPNVIARVVSIDHEKTFLKSDKLFLLYKRLFLCYNGTIENNSLAGLFSPAKKKITPYLYCDLK